MARNTGALQQVKYAKKDIGALSSIAAVAGGRIMSSLANHGGLAAHGGIAGKHGGLAA